MIVLLEFYFNADPYIINFGLHIFFQRCHDYLIND